MDELCPRNLSGVGETRITTQKLKYRGKVMKEKDKLFRKRNQPNMETGP